MGYDEGAFYLCKTMQNIYIGSRNIKIQWLSNEDHIIPAKENPDQDIYAPDFYDKTDFETILTSVELTEDNPDGLDISLYKGEDQLDEIEKRKNEKDKSEKKAPTLRGKKKSDNVED